MSVVLAYVHGDDVYMGGDRIVIRGDEVTYGKKVLHFDSCIVGITGCRDSYCNLIRFPPPAYIPEEYDGDFNKFVYGKLYEWGEKDVLQCLPSTGLMAYSTPEGPELIVFDTDDNKNWFCIERLDLSLSPYASIGYGSPYVRGAFEALLDVNKDNEDLLSPEEMIRRAIYIACNCCTKVQPDKEGNIDVIKLSRE